MKGLLKGLRYIARIFENEKEPEMQIGKPTDVKHVAHIGWEGPSSTTPSWMNEFKAPELMSGSTRKPGNQTERQKKGRRKLSTGTSNSPVDSPSRVGPTKQSKRNNGGKHRDQSTGSGSGLDLPSQTEHSTASKHTTQKKSKGSSGRGSEAVPVERARTAHEKDIPVRGVCPFTGLGTSTGR
ncbi:PREDICTED: CRIB domain-containing protein RIC5-like isoform X2 [Tarenaya hassleriana]|nr:PREDICTED: CRIB domain-containing protein RIC5-like isoform X2 [Tarenaya hassleriana]XP_010532669.1 PREDICTED: CRIB domain-containing protein RIC5-like isoform X2 [Tarenaya hassleriana]